MDDLPLIPVTTKQEMADDLAEHSPWGTYTALEHSPWGTYTALDDERWRQRAWSARLSRGWLWFCVRAWPLALSRTSTRQ